MKNRDQKISFAVSVCFHLCLAFLLFFTFEKTILVPANPVFDPNKPIIDAALISNQELKKEVARLEEKVEKEREQERQRIKEVQRKTKEKEELEEKMALELEKQKEKEKLKEENEAKIALEKKKLEEKKEKERIAKLKEEEEKQKKIKKAKEEALAKKKLEDEQKIIKKKELDRLQALEKERADELAKAQARQANMRVNQDEITRHALLIRNKIHQFWRQPIGFDIDGLTCKLAVKLLPTGEVIDAVVVQSSGSLEFDRSAELAIRKASPLPMPQSSSVANEFRQFTFTFRPEAV